MGAEAKGLKNKGKMMMRTLTKRGGTPSITFMFAVFFYLFIYVIMFLIAQSYADFNPVQTGCVSTQFLGIPTLDLSPLFGINGLGIIVSLVTLPIAIIAYILTFGLTASCGIPAAILWLIGAINAGFITVLSVMTVFLLRGSQ